MGKSSKNNPKINSDGDPSDELLKTLIRDINLDEHEVKSLNEMNNEISVDEETSTKNEMPDGLEITSVSDSADGIAGIQGEEEEKNLEHLLNQKFGSEKSEIGVPSHSDQNSEVSSMHFRDMKRSISEKKDAKKPTKDIDLSSESSIEPVRTDDVVQINNPTVVNKSENLHNSDYLAELNNPPPELVFSENGSAPVDVQDIMKNEDEGVSQVFTSNERSNNDKTVALAQNRTSFKTNISISDKTVAVAGYSDRYEPNLEEKVKVSIGQVRTSPLSSWNKADSNLGIAHNMELAQEKIIALEKENESLRHQNDELVAAAEIIKERADMLAAEMNFLKNDRDSLEQSFKNELMIVRNQLNRKDSEIQKANAKTEELDSRLKFDMKKIRVRERELENRLELLRAEKNALVKSKDEMILDLRRKCDQFQLETESFRQKCIELNKVIESSQESVKRTTRALRLAMANLEIQDEGKQLIKKAE